MRPVRMACGAHRVPLLGEARRDNRTIRCDLGVPPPWAMVVACRARYALRVSLGAPGCLLSLLQSSAGLEWRTELLRGCLAMQRVLAPKLDSLGDPFVGPAGWEAFWRRWPSQWRSLIRAFLARCARSQRPPATVDGMSAMDSSSSEWLCGDCGSSFASGRAVACHRSRRHAVRTGVHRFVLTSMCLGCGEDFHTVVRARRHVLSSLVCRARVLGGGVDECSSSEEIARVDELARVALRQSRKLGVDPLAGPPPKRARTRGAV